MYTGNLRAQVQGTGSRSELLYKQGIIL